MCWPSRAWCVLASFLTSSSSSSYGYLLCSSPSCCNSAYGNDFEEFHLLSARMEFDQNHGQQRVPKDLSDALVWKKNSLLQMILIRLYDIIEVCLDLFVRVLDIIEVGLGLQQPTLWYHRVGWCKSKLLLRYQRVRQKTQTELYDIIESTKRTRCDKGRVTCVWRSDPPRIQNPKNVDQHPAGCRNQKPQAKRFLVGCKNLECRAKCRANRFLVGFLVGSRNLECRANRH